MLGIGETRATCKARFGRNYWLFGHTHRILTSSTKLQTRAYRWRYRRSWLIKSKLNSDTHDNLRTNSRRKFVLIQKYLYFEYKELVKFLTFYYLINAWISDCFIRIWLKKMTKIDWDRMISIPLERSHCKDAKNMSKPLSDYLIIS